MSPGEALARLVREEPKTKKLFQIHLLLLLVGVAGLLAVAGILVSGIARPEEPIQAFPRMVAFAAGFHGILCAVGLALASSKLKRLRQPQSDDASRLQRLIAHQTQRQLTIFILSILGQLVVFYGVLEGLDFNNAPWLVLCMVPSFLLISIGIRQFSSHSLLCDQVRRLRDIQQRQNLNVE